MTKGCCSKVSSFFSGSLFPLCVTYFWATWGNRMWNFAFGLYLVLLAEKNLRLTAIYGFLMSIAILLFGSSIGNWVDRTNRQTAVRVSIFLQKILVIACSAAVCVTLNFPYHVDTIWGGALHYVVNGTIIVLAILAELATMSYQRIELEKDWFVVVTAGNQSKLANLNMATRIIDQITNIVTPIVTGIIMTSISKIFAGIVVIVWHIAALFVEIFLTTRIYSITPAMKNKGADSSSDEKIPKRDNFENGKVLPKESKALMTSENEKHAEVENDEEKSKIPCSSFWIGWPVYARQTVVFAGISLSLLYMTVLGFDGVTTGYIYANGLPESHIGVATAFSSLAGVLGALLYKPLHKCLGLERSGIVSFTFQISCLTLSVLSIWLPGSPFDPDALFDLFSGHQNSTVTSSAISFTNGSSEVILIQNETTTTEVMSENINSVVTPSIVVFVVAIVISRIGLWVSDLVVCQLQQENVPEAERGTVNGVQNSLNSLMDMLKSILVILLPTIETFGYLIVISSFSVFCGVLTFYYHSFKVSDYSVKRCCAGKTQYSKCKTEETISVSV